MEIKKTMVEKEVIRKEMVPQHTIVVELSLNQAAILMDITGNVYDYKIQGERGDLLHPIFNELNKIFTGGGGPHSWKERVSVFKRRKTNKSGQVYLKEASVVVVELTVEQAAILTDISGNCYDYNVNRDGEAHEFCKIWDMLCNDFGGCMVGCDVWKERVKKFNASH